MNNDTPAGTKYRIQTLDDFLKVPEDEIGECLEEFRRFLHTARRMKETSNARLQWMLRNWQPRERDELLGGFEPAFVKRFLYTSARPRPATPPSNALPPVKAVKTTLPRPD